MPVHRARWVVAWTMLAVAETRVAAQELGDGGPDAGRIVWFRADDGVHTNFSNLVTKWDDHGGSARHVKNALGESNPEWIAAGLNGQPALHFDGNDFLYGYWMPTGSYTKVVVASIDDTAYTNNLVSGFYHHALYFGGTKAARLFHSGDFVKSAVDIVAGEPFILVGTYDANTGLGQLYLNGLLVGSGFAAIGNWDGTLLLGSFAFSWFMKGSIAEVMLYDHVLDPGENARVHDYLKRRYFREPVPQVKWSERPRPGQLYQRDASNQAPLDLRGKVMTPGAIDVTLDVARDGVPWFTKTKPLSYVSGHASFVFSPALPAGKHDYDATVHVRDAAKTHLVATIPALTVGDVYVINGQSNAQASDYYYEGLANQAQSHWLRSFGTASIWGATEFDLHWDVADGENYLGHASIGQWAIRLGQMLHHQEDLPIAIVNGAVGGTSISLHQRNSANPTDPSTIYGRLLLRLREAGVADQCKALLWYQGESDSSNPSGWFADWLALRSSWATDYPALERIYVAQIRTDCFGGGQAIKEIQRTLPDLHSDETVMSTTALPAHDGCHFLYAGYHELGERLAHLILRDFYDSNDTYEIDPPNIDHASWGDASHTKLVLTMRDPDDRLVVDAGAEANFSTNTSDTILSASVVGNRVTLTLAQPSLATTVSYDGHAYDGPWFKNARGVGALCFYDVVIQ